MKKAFQKLREKRGDSSLITAVMIMIVVLIGTALLFSVAVIAPKAAAAYTAANEIADKVAQDGQYGSEEQSYTSSYLSSAGLGASVSCDHSGAIQMGETFTIKVTTHVTVGVGNIGHISIPVTVQSTEKSKIYTAGA